MAEKVTGAPKPKKAKAAASENGLGHNLDVLRKKGGAAMERLFKLQKTMDSELAGFRADFAHAYEEEAEEIGIKKGILIKEFKRALTKKRQEEKELMMETDERETIEALRSALDGTPMGKWFEGQLAKPVQAGE